MIFEKMKDFKKQPLTLHSWFGTQLQDGSAFVLFINKMARSLYLRPMELSIGHFTEAYYKAAVSNRSSDIKRGTNDQCLCRSAFIKSHKT